MRVMIKEKRVIITGKAWEVQALLKKYAKQYKFVKDWLDDCTTIE